MDKTIFLMKKYQKELQETVNGMEQIRQEIVKLDKLGVELTNKANYLAGKIESLKELAELVEKDVNDEEVEEEVVTEMTQEQLIQAIERGASDGKD